MSRKSTTRLGRIVAGAMAALLAACEQGPTKAQLDADNPVRPNAPPPFGMEEFFAGAAFLEALNGKGYQDQPPNHFPQ